MDLSVARVDINVRRLLDEIDRTDPVQQLKFMIRLICGWRHAVIKILDEGSPRLVINSLAWSATLMR